MKKKKLLFTGGGGIFTETIWNYLSDKYDIFFADINPKKIFYKIPKQKKLKIAKGNSKNFLKSINLLDKKYNFDLIIPNVDEEIYAITNSNYKNKKIFLPPLPFCKLTLNKLSFFNYLRKKKIENLNTYRLNFFKNFKKGKRYLIKPIYGRGSRFVGIVKNEKEIQNFLNFYNLKKKDFIIQDYIIGTEYTVFVNKNEKKTVVIPVKVYQKKGITTHAKVEKNFMIEKHIKKLINYFNVKNCFNVQLIYKNKKIYILEINPRLSTTFALIVKSGYDPFDKKLSLKFFLKKKLKMYRYLTTRYY